MIQQKRKIRDKHSEAEISEIFSSLQGEGPYLGVKQIFVRFGRCNMHCGYCDEVEKMQESAFSVYSCQTLLEAVSALETEKESHHSVSLTGGEPLFYAPFLEKFLPQLKQKGFKTYLETNGTLPKELARVIQHCDIIAMDMKPASSTGDRSFCAEHEAFLRIASAKDTFVKVVVTPDTQAEEVVRCAEIVRRINPGIPFILQPVSDAFGIQLGSLKLIENGLFQQTKRRLADVRVIPQMHKIWGVR